MIRDDLSNKLIHLTRGQTYSQAAIILFKILVERQLLGGIGGIKGGFRCVCFSEAPLSKLGYILANPVAHQMPYAPFGVMIDKRWLFERGGRPVIYQPDSEYSLLDDQQKFRHKCYDPTNSDVTDFTWEREWRIQTDALTLEPSELTVIVPSRSWENMVVTGRERHLSLVNAQRKNGKLETYQPLYEVAWHFVALEDLGVPIPIPDEERH